jgi:hypothetical protein
MLETYTDSWPWKKMPGLLPGGMRHYVSAALFLKIGFATKDFILLRPSDILRTTENIVKSIKFRGDK